MRGFPCEGEKGGRNSQSYISSGFVVFFSTLGKRFKILNMKTFQFSLSPFGDILMFWGKRRMKIVF